MKGKILKRRFFTAALALALSVTMATGVASSVLTAFAAPSERIENAVTEGENLLYDPSFEISQSADRATGAQVVKRWAHTSGIYGGIDKNTDAVDGTSRGYFVSNCDGVAGETQFTFFQDVEVEKYTEYRLRFWVRRWCSDGTWIKGENACSALHYGIADPLTGGFAPVAETVNDDIGVKYEQEEFTFNSGNRSLVRVQLYNVTVDWDGKGATGYHFDAFSLQKILSTVDTDADVVKNGDFSNSDIASGDGTQVSADNWTAIGTNMQRPLEVYCNMDNFASTNATNDGGEYADYSFGGWGTRSHDINGVQAFGVSETGWWDPGMWLRAKTELDTTKKYTVEFTLLKHSDISDDFNLQFQVEWFSTAEKDNNHGNKRYSLTDQLQDQPKNEWVTVSCTIDFPAEGCYGYESMGLFFYDNTYWNNGGDHTVPAGTVVHGVYLKQLVIKEYVDPATPLESIPSVGIDGEKGKAYLMTASEYLPENTFGALYQDITLSANTRYNLSANVELNGRSSDMPALHVAVLAQRGTDVTDPAWEMIFSGASDFAGEKNITFESGDDTNVRLMIYATSAEYNAQTGTTGYYIKNVRLCSFAALTAAKISVKDTLAEGEEETPVIAGMFGNGAEDILCEGDGFTVTYTSDNSAVLAVREGKLVAVGAGTANVTADITYYGANVTSEAKQITVISSEDPSVLASVSCKLEEKTITTCSSSALEFTLTMGDGSTIEQNAQGVTIVVETSDPSVLLVSYRNGVWYATGRKCGSAELLVTATVGTTEKTTKLEITIDDGNLLEDSGFEDPDHSAWTVTGNADGGFDYVLSGNVQSYTDIGNMWTWSTTNEQRSISQDVALKTGNYTLGAMINRFYGSGKNVWAGVATFGAVAVKDGEPVEATRSETSFDTSYGGGGYAEVLHLFTVEEAGMYRVYAVFRGDEQNGMGFQLDNMTLFSNPAVKEITASLGTDNKIKVDDIERITLTAIYEDDTSKALTGYTFTIANTAVATKQGSYVYGVAAGTTDITVSVEIYGKTYTKTFTVTVEEKGGGTNLPDGKDDPDGKDNTVAIAVGVSVAVAVVAAAAVVTVVFIKKKKNQK